MAENTLYPRFVEWRLTEALEDSPVVLIQGPRQCGKTTLAQVYTPERWAGADRSPNSSSDIPRDYSYFTFDDAVVRAGAEADPIGFVADLPERVILDEVQRVPALFAALKMEVDRRRRPGRFLLTGSSNVLHPFRPRVRLRRYQTPWLGAWKRSGCIRWPSANCKTARPRPAPGAAPRAFLTSFSAAGSRVVALHDIGKVNIGFQARIWRTEDLPPRRKKPPRMGHISDLAPVLEYKDEETADWFLNDLGAPEFLTWDDDDGATASGLLIAAFSHHGTPLNLSANLAPNPAARRPFGDLNPRQCVRRMVRLVRAWFPAAYTPGGAPMPSAPAFQHMFLGLCTLADWLGSDERFFEFCDRAQDGYMDLARERARKAVSDIGLDLETQRNALPDLPGFATLFDIDGKPNVMQKKAADLPLDEPLVIIESETGSGKTEAALWRFARMYEAGLVDGLYFALPTRSAATQIHGRVTRCVGKMFPEGHTPEPVLAVPGYLRAGACRITRSGGMTNSAPPIR